MNRCNCRVACSDSEDLCTGCNGHCRAWGQQSTAAEKVVRSTAQERQHLRHHHHHHRKTSDQRRSRADAGAGRQHRNRVGAGGGRRQRWCQFEGLWYGRELVALDVLRTATSRNKQHPCIPTETRVVSWYNRKRRPPLPAAVRFSRFTLLPLPPLTSLGVLPRETAPPLRTTRSHASPPPPADGDGEDDC